MSDVPDPRPRPAYGEYATPEEQRARIKDPGAAWVYSPAADAVVAPEQAAPAQPVPEPAPAGVRAGRPHPVDRVVTLALLAYGLINVAFTAFSFLDLASVAQQAMDLMGIEGEFTNVDAARTWGIVAAVVLVVGYVATAALSVLQLRRGRIAWWIPLAGAVATYLVVYVCLAVPLLGDPAFIGYVSNPS
ncbi:DUF6264 family protein [Microbacterium sp. BWT-B31]|uniref:DUF6264 family protein n=1 Tax=Microbacterium sp. BWT-B31 TaxID=3232072 RepID=UPI003526F864